MRASERLVAMPFEPLVLVPRDEHQTLWTVVCWIATAVAFLTIHRVYRVGDRYPRLKPYAGVIAAFAALWISWIPIQLLTRWYSGHFLWPPTWQSAPFWLGDLLLLPMVAARFAVMRGRLAPHERPRLLDSRRWAVGCAVAGVLAGLWFHYKGHPPYYPPEEWWAPAKLEHDYVAYPVFTYYLGTQVPLLARARRYPVEAAGAVLCFAGWYVLTRLPDVEPLRLATATLLAVAALSAITVASRHVRPLAARA